MTQKKWVTYTALISDKIIEMIQDGEINGKELEENATDFLFALACCVPANIHNKLTGTDMDMLEFNHLANKLCHQYMNVKESNEVEED